MGYSRQNAAVRRDKHQFFSKIPSTGTLNSKFEAVDQRAETIGYSFLLNNKHLLETEFTEMFNILKNQDDENKEAFWLYCYYCASLLEAFYAAYLQPGKQAEFATIKLQIKERLINKVKHKESDTAFIESLYNSYLGSFRNLVNSPFHVSQIRDYVAYANLCRIYWAFCRMTLTQGLTMAKDLHLIEKLDVILGTHTDVDKIISVFQAPIGVINFFSVGFFLIRFMIDGGLLIQHTFFPTELEKGAKSGCDVTRLDHLPGAASIEAYRNSYILVQEDDKADVELYYIPKKGSPLKLTARDTSKLKEDLLSKLIENGTTRLTADEVKEIITAQTDHVPEVTTAYERFMHELYKRHCNFANDLVWATVNCLTNFNNVFQISGPVAGYLTAVFLTFDVCMALYKCKLAEQEYLTKKSQYLLEIQDYNNPELFKKMTDEQRRLHIEMLHKQLLELEINWRTKEATFYFVAAAAALLMLGFTTAILVSPPMLVLASFFVCTVAVAMYLSTGAYSQYKEKSLYLEQAQLTDTNLPVAYKEFEIARNDFIFTMVKNTVMPMVLITTFAVCWPAAIALTAMYLGYELYHAHDQHKETRAARQLALDLQDGEEENMGFLPCNN
ncbi:hypothetical protein [Legionella quateirensis]|uniref:Coiled-coil protein n=1 Tax=Legionella quateirensis TaxID=45072 RepID=A0A378KY98_9GAMM|nr:hypothetical protein [Legionella quateirensis]KTD44862.1 coiled-coil protein [Legionella quateirensis]STY19515.1 coiled-coil protein [Legionella quateirensis]